MASLKQVFAFSIVGGGVLLAGAREARAGLEACNNIEVSASARCKVETEVDCTTKCTPVSFEAACAGKLEAQCDGECNATATVDCKGSCTATCQGQCEADPGSFDCQGSCNASCQADCSGECASAGNKTECEASCKATCSGSCDAKCEGTPPSATCEGKCAASCEGSCEGKANIDCQVSCQSKGYLDCKAQMEGGCKTRCSEPSGALFCDGQYVDTGNNLKECIDALNAYLNAKVEASGSAECVGNECTAEGKVSSSCAAAPEGSASSASLWALGALGAVGVAASRRRRR